MQSDLTHEQQIKTKLREHLEMLRSCCFSADWSGIWWHSVLSPKTQELMPAKKRHQEQ